MKIDQLNSILDCDQMCKFYQNKTNKQTNNMICQDDSDDDVLMVQDTDPGLPPHAHTLSIGFSDNDNFNNRLHCPTSVGFSVGSAMTEDSDDNENFFPNSLAALPDPSNTLRLPSIHLLFQRTLSRTTNLGCTSASTVAPQPDQETANAKRLNLDNATNLCSSFQIL
jgi:hypothetical protein